MNSHGWDGTDAMVNSRDCMGNGVQDGSAAGVGVGVSTDSRAGKGSVDHVESATGCRGGSHGASTPTNEVGHSAHLPARF